jgi:hypothetical protein
MLLACLACHTTLSPSCVHCGCTVSMELHALYKCVAETASVVLCTAVSACPSAVSGIADAQLTEVRASHECAAETASGVLTDFRLGEVHLRVLQTQIQSKTGTVIGQSSFGRTQSENTTISHLLHELLEDALLVCLVCCGQAHGFLSLVVLRTHKAAANIQSVSCRRHTDTDKHTSLHLPSSSRLFCACLRPGRQAWSSLAALWLCQSLHPLAQRTSTTPSCCLSEEQC